jgi:PhoH-like ATPase
LTIGLSYHHEPALAMDLTRMDNKIVLCALKLKHEGQRVFFVSKDINARVKATALGIHAVDYEKQKVNVDKIYNGYRELEIGKDMIHAIEKGEEVSVDAKMVANEFAILKNPKEKGFRLGRYSLTAEKLQPVQPLHNPSFGH